MTTQQTTTNIFYHGYMAIPGYRTKRQISIDDITKAVCAEFGLTREQLCERNRHHNICFPRQVAHWLALNLTNKTQHEIGKQIGGLNHSTVITSRRVVNNYMETNPTKRGRVAYLKGLLTM